jgi:hypothetical protein
MRHATAVCWQPSSATSPQPNALASKAESASMSTSQLQHKQHDWLKLLCPHLFLCMLTLQVAGTCNAYQTASVSCQGYERWHYADAHPCKRFLQGLETSAVYSSSACMNARHLQRYRRLC